MKYRLLSPAAIEIEEAVLYYESKEPGLGNELLIEYEKALSHICLFPKAWSIIGENEIRRCLLERFPYCILYSIIKTEIVICAFMHLHREPDYWKNRL